MSDHQLPRCLHCGAQQLGPATSCWLCEKPLDRAPIGSPPFAEQPDLPAERFNFSLATLFLILTLASVAMGLVVALPGLGILACIVMVPVLFRTMRVVRHRERFGHEVSAAEKVSMFLGSFVVSSVLVIVVCIAAFCSFCGVCASMFAFGSPDVEAKVLAIGMIILGILAFVVAVKIKRWNRQRFRREIGEE